MNHQNLPSWIATGVSLLTLAVVFFSGFATKDDLAAVERQIDAVQVDVRDLRDDIRALNNRIDNILPAARDTAAQ